MIARLLAHLRQQWMGAIALFLVLTGGVAYAANTVFSTDIVNDQVFSADVRNDTFTGGGLTAADLRNGAVGNTEIADGAVRSAEVQNEALTGADIKNQSGVDTCSVVTARIAELCVRAENNHRTWANAFLHCANADLRLPTLGEARQLALTHDIPNVDEGEDFWTSDQYESEGQLLGGAVSDNGSYGFSQLSSEFETVCVTIPTS